MAHFWELLPPLLVNKLSHTQKLMVFLHPLCIQCSPYWVLLLIQATASVTSVASWEGSSSPTPYKGLNEPVGKFFLPKIPNLRLEIPHFGGEFRSKVYIWAPTNSSVGNLQMPVRKSQLPAPSPQKNFQATTPLSHFLQAFFHFDKVKQKQ